MALPVFWMLGYVSHAQATPYLLFSWFIPIPVDAWIAYRGVFSQLKGLSRVRRSLALALVVFVAMAASALLSSVFAGIWINFQHG